MKRNAAEEAVWQGMFNEFCDREGEGRVDPDRQASFVVAALCDAIRSDPSVLVALGMEQVGWGHVDGFDVLRTAQNRMNPWPDGFPVFAVGSSSDKEADE